MLKEHLLELDHHHHLKSLGIGYDLKSPSHEALQEFLLRHYLISRARVDLFACLDSHIIGAIHHPPEWLHPFMLSMCAQFEHYFRLSLGMSSVLDPDPARAKIIASEHGIYFNLVKNGVEDLQEAWESIVSHIDAEEISDQLATYHLYLSQYPH